MAALCSGRSACRAVVIVCVILALWLSMAVVPLVASSVLGPLANGGLFEGPADGVTVVEGEEDFAAEVFGRPNRNPFELVLFYASWCGHCQRFAPIFKQFAQDTTGWRRMVNIAVVNCASAKNTGLCRDHEVAHYPTLLLFWMESSTKSSLRGESITAGLDVAGLRSSVIEGLEKKLEESPDPVKAQLDLRPSRAASLGELWSAAPVNVTQFIIVVENNASFVGREIMLDFSSVQGVKAARFICGSGPEELKHKSAISLLSLHKGLHPTLLKTVPEEAEARDVFKKELEHVGFSFSLSKTNVTTHRFHSIKLSHSPAYNHVHLDDIETGLNFLLHNELALQKEFDEKELHVLKNFIQSIYENVQLPLRIRAYLQRIRHKLEEKDRYTSAEYERIVANSSTNENFLRKGINYVHCKGSKPGKRGYPCFLWTLFHLITVGSYQQYHQHQVPNPQRCVLAIRDYVSHFFSCESCARHFSEDAKNVESELLHANDTVLWLWKSHNKVNARLKGDLSEDPEFPKVQFPESVACPQCRNQSDNFVESEVLAFLIAYYNSSTIVLPNKSTPERITASSETDSTANAPV